jgi:serine/threonine protein kinase
MAAVFEAIDLVTGQPVALKVPFPRYQREPFYSARFTQEEEIGASLSHPSILRIIPFKEKSRPYIVMERLEGELLADVLKRERRLPVDRALGIAIRVAQALEYMHERKVLHRDLKPGNIMLCKDGSIRVLDFGLATSEGGPTGPAFGFIPSLGTPDYMPPEHVRGKMGDERSDIYCLGVILYEMLTGAVPFRGKDLFALMHARVVGDPIRPGEVNPELSPQLEEIILHALERDPRARYARMSEFRKDLEAPEQVIPTGRAQRLEPPRPLKILWRRTQHFVWTLVVILLLMALLVLGVLAFAKPRTGSSGRVSLGRSNVRITPL